MLLEVTKEIADLILTFILTVATVYLAIYTYKLVDESRKARKAQVQPYISIHLDQAETDPSLLFIIMRNIGPGTAHELKFEVIQDIQNENKTHKIAELGLFKEGMKFCPSGYTKRNFLIETRHDYKAKMEEVLIIKAKYNNIFNEHFEQEFRIALKEQAMSSKIAPSDKFIGQISETLQEIKSMLKMN